MFYTGKFKTTLSEMIFSEGSEAEITNAASNDIGHVRLIAEQISKLIPNGGKLLSCNSAVFVEMNLTPPIPFGYWESLAEWAYSTREDKSLNRHHLITEEQLLGMVEQQYFDVVLVDAMFPGVSGQNQEITERYQQKVSQYYILYKQFGESHLYVKPSIIPVSVGS
jgi:CheY-like chemotaxis protein